MLSNFFSSFTIYADAPDEKEGKVEESPPEKEEETPTEEEAEEEEPEDVYSVGPSTLFRMLNFGGRFIPP